MEIYIFARFHARSGAEAGVEEALQAVVASSREEAGCVSIHSYHSIRDPQLFYIHSRWEDEAAFETHAGLLHTVEFIERVEPLLDHPVEAQRCQVMD
jgi:quinol monooxygenase YgiN